MRSDIGAVLALLAVAMPAAGQDRVSVPLARVRADTLEQTTVLSGELRPFQEVELRPRVEGFIETIPVDRGSRVRRGELVALLRAPELEARRAEAQERLAVVEAQLAEAEAKSAASEGSYERLQKAALTPGVVAGNDLFQAEKLAEADSAQVAAANRSVEAARDALEAVEEMTRYLRVTAPFDGVVTERYTHVGSLVGPNSGSPIVHLEEVHPLRLVTPVPEAYAMAAAVGTEVSFTVSAHPSVSFSAVVSRPALSVSRATRTMAVEADVDNTGDRLAPGMYAEVSWPVRRGSESLFVPRSAVAETSERVFVIRVRGGRAEWVDVRRGAFQGDDVEVFGALAAGDQVVLAATDEIRPGTSVSAR